ncbi:MAG: putative rRNA maturation factor [Rickettsiales bacterium]|jgi:probable rRNA maturation factor
MKIRTDITINEKLWKTDSSISKKIKSLIKEIIPQTPLKSLSKNIKEIEISVLLTNDEQIQELNKNYRQKDQPTNVLSFPMLNGEEIKNGDLSKLEALDDCLVLGDIVISYQTILRESEEQQKDFDHHLTHLLVHSLLHLIGFDHIDEDDAKIMEDLEIEVLHEVGIDNPYLSKQC